MAEEILVVLTTWPDIEMARAATRALVEEQLAACGNLVPGVESIYRWQGKIETSAEVIVIFKTVATLYARFEARLRELHPYEVPEIIAAPVLAGLPEYLNWVKSSCS
ncbi:MAG: divalent-cation tolerance protein CutA [Chthoniobacter sp.]|nr:divalent-cation tolerance protein CutA [Chthoniobacter sp.]